MLLTFARVSLFPSVSGFLLTTASTPNVTLEKRIKLAQCCHLLHWFPTRLPPPLNISIHLHASILSIYVSACTFANLHPQVRKHACANGLYKYRVLISLFHNFLSGIEKQRSHLPTGTFDRLCGVALFRTNMQLSKSRGR